MARAARASNWARWPPVVAGLKAAGNRDAHSRTQFRFAPGELIGGRYRVQRTDVGGIGEVYFCFDETAKAPLVLKTLRGRFLQPSVRNDRLRARLQGEAAIWASVGNHPNVVRCFYLTQIDGAPFLCLEWVADPDRENVSLQYLIAKQGPLGVRRALEVAMDVCRGLIHVAGKQPDFVHRDIKAENVLIAQSGTAKVTDFGFAQVGGGVRIGAAGSPVLVAPAPDQVVGTPTTMAPEQWIAGSVDSRADIYAIGCVLFRMLAGSGPFKGKERKDFRAAHRHAPVPTLDSGLPESVIRLVHRCMAKSPDDRFQTMGDLLEAIETVYEEQFQMRPLPPAPCDRPTVSDRVNRANTYYNLGHFHDAQSEFDALLETDPMAAAHYGRALTCQARGLHAEALAAYACVFEQQPNHAAAYYNRGNLHLAMGNRRAAIGDYTSALGANPLLPEAWNNRGLLRLEAGRREEALSDFGCAVAGGSREARSNRAVMLLEEGLLAEAGADLEQLASDERATPADFVNRARSRHAFGQLRGALDDYTVALAGGATPIGELHHARARVYLDLGRPQSAIEDLSVAIRQRDGGMLAAYRRRAQTWYDLGATESAIADYAEVISRAPEDADAYYGLALVLGGADRFADAVSCLNEAARRGHQGAGRALESFRRKDWVPPTWLQTQGGTR